ncbi:MAG: glycosyltransferase family 117 protein [Bacteroidia bacterium]
MTNYSKINNISGWVIFLISAFVYLSTIEPTASFWDAGEFIATAFKLQVGHPPGAPLFLMLGKIFSLFAGGNAEMIPVMVNAMSALASAFTILFLFWTITYLAKRILIHNKPDLNTENFPIASLITVIGAGVVGALAYTFTDSFWFSAVEGEVYALSSFFTAFVFWAMLKWDNHADEKHSDRWLILIAYMMGLSIGVHLLNLLTIPALAFIYYFRRYKVSTGGIIKTAAAGMVILTAIQYGIIPGIVSVATKFELLFVNTIGLPLGTGGIIYSLILISAIIYGIIYSRKHNKVLLNSSLLCFAFILLGYTSFAQIVIRSSANPPMDENNPENVFSLLAYLNREQYGDRPLMYGQYYDAQVIRQEEGAMNYIQGEEKYEPTTRKIIPVYDSKRSTILPRMHSSQTSHVSAYKEWGKIKEGQLPGFGNNIRFLWDYQLGHMYWRYFMWNFVGRQNDIQGHGGITKGNWISGINFIDAWRLGPQEKLPKSMTENKAYNKFYFLPLLLGLIGIYFHFKRDTNNAIIVLLLFFFTGIAIVLYLNGTPYQPRERDYAYAGSYYAFAIWIGIGVMGITELLSRKLNGKLAAIFATIISLSVPAVLAKDGWDDHNRSHRYTARDFATNYLNSLAPNSIIFTNGDNDTFPLWYAQEVEGVRTDVRVINLSLLNTDWYIDQMHMKAYESDPIPFSLKHSQYVQGTRDYIPFYDRGLNRPVELKQLISFITSENAQHKVSTQGGTKLNYYPSKSFVLNIDKDAVLRSGTVKEEDADKIVSSIEWTIGQNYLMKADIMILDLLANFDWERPIYFAVTVNNENFMNLQDYFRLEGLAYRFVPVKSPNSDNRQPGFVAEDIMFDNMMNKFRWGNMNDPRVYLDQNNINMASNFRNNFARMAETLLANGKRDSALAALDRCMEVMPDETVPFNVFTIRLAELYYLCDTPPSTSMLELANPEVMTKTAASQKANAIIKRLAEIYEDDLNYYFSLRGTSYMQHVERDMNQGMAVMQELIRISRAANETQLSEELSQKFNALQASYTRTSSLP